MLGQLLLAALLAPAGGEGAAETAPSGAVSVEAPGTMLFLRHPATAPIAGLEQRLADDLGLILDGFATILVEIGDAAFWTAPLEDQIDRVSPLAERYRAAATAWLSQSGSGRYLLHLVALQNG